MNIEEIAAQFKIQGNIDSINPYGRGHINHNFLVNVSEKNGPGYFLQKINHHVFRDVELLMNNLNRVTEHLEAKIRKRYPEDYFRRTLTVVPTMTGSTYLKDPAGSYWRMMGYIAEHKVHDRCESADLAYEGARMFGRFINMLSDLNPDLIGETIPDFHKLSHRLSALQGSYQKDMSGRAHQVREDISYVEGAASLMGTVQDLSERKVIPLRITHNDTKINNVLFDRKGRGLCVVDLDTVMPGLAHYDFGDGIRTFTNTGYEDSQDLNEVSMDLVRYRAYATGFVDGMGDLLLPEERESLHFGGILFPFIMGVRFLTDYLNGDIYFRTEYDDHNLVRARSQFRLAQDGTAKLEEARRIITEIS